MKCFHWASSNRADSLKPRHLILCSYVAWERRRGEKIVFASHRSQAIPVLHSLAGLMHRQAVETPDAALSVGLSSSLESICVLGALCE